MQPGKDRLQLEKQVGLLWTWWRGDPLPSLAPIAALTVERTEDIQLVTELVQITTEDAAHRILIGHRLYVARLEDAPVAYGWSATNDAAFGLPVVAFQVPPANRYLYHFETLAMWRGRGIYPRLLQRILTIEQVDNERFWIINEQPNEASARGIARAGFRLADEVYTLVGGGLGLVAANDKEHAHTGATVLGLPLIIPVAEPE